MNGMPLWISIFAAGLSVGVIFAKPNQFEDASPVADSTVAAIEIGEVATPLSGPLAVVKSDSEVLARLEQRLATLEDRVVALEEAPTGHPASVESPADGDIDRQNAPQTPSEQTLALVTVGFEPAKVDEILRLHNQHQLERLEIRDRAAREGWLDTSEFWAVLRDAGDRTARVRQELGDDEYDSYLYALGLSNRVALQTLIPQGEAALAGLRAGDVITSYAGERVFRPSDLQQATSAGERGELVPIQVLRGEDTLELYAPRGPLGVTISGLVQAP